MFLLDKISNGFSNFGDSVMQAFYTGVLIVCVCAIVGVVLASLFKLRKVNSALAVVVSSIGCVLISFPMIGAFDQLVAIKSLKTVTAETEKKRLELENQQLEYQNRQLEIEKMNQQVKVAGLKEEIDLLKNAQMSLQNFGKICEVALLAAQLNQTEVKKEQLGEAKQGTIDSAADKFGISKLGIDLGKTTYADEVLVITTHDINAKFGIDLNDVRIKKVNDTTLNICGLQSKYIGSDKNISDTIVSEIRRNKFSNGTKVNTTISTSTEDQQRALELAKQYEKEFQERLAKGVELTFMNDSVVKLGQNFLTVILSSLNMELTFNEDDAEGSVPILEYFETELAEKETEIKENDVSGV